MKPWMSMPKEVGKDTTPAPLPITKPRRQQYPPGSEGNGLFKKDLKDWEAVRRQTPQGYAAAKLLRKNSTGEDE